MTAPNEQDRQVLHFLSVPKYRAPFICAVLYRIPSMCVRHAQAAERVLMAKECVNMNLHATKCSRPDKMKITNELV